MGLVQELDWPSAQVTCSGWVGSLSRPHCRSGGCLRECLHHENKNNCMLKGIFVKLRWPLSTVRYFRNKNQLSVTSIKSLLSPGKCQKHAARSFLYLFPSPCKVPLCLVFSSFHHPSSFQRNFRACLSFQIM